MSGDQAPLSDHGLIAPITLPADGRIPDADGSSTKAEYDGYFRLKRERADLEAWSRSCLEVQRQILADLDDTGLSAEDRSAILAGCVVLLQNTLDRWVPTRDLRQREVA